MADFFKQEASNKNVGSIANNTDSFDSLTKAATTMGSQVAGGVKHKLTKLKIKQNNMNVKV